MKQIATGPRNHTAFSQKQCTRWVYENGTIPQLSSKYLMVTMYVRRHNMRLCILGLRPAVSVYRNTSTTNLHYASVHRICILAEDISISVDSIRGYLRVRLLHNSVSTTPLTWGPHVAEAFSTQARNAHVWTTQQKNLSGTCCEH